MFAKATLALLALALSARATITVSTPGDDVQCKTIEFTVGGDATGTLLANVMKSNEPCGTPVTEDIAIDATTKTFKWTATEPGAYVVVVDNELEEGWSATFNIAANDGSSCGEANGSSPTTLTTGDAARATGTARTGSNNVPANAAPSNGNNDSSLTGGASRTAVGGVTALAFIGAVAAALSI